MLIEDFLSDAFPEGIEGKVYVCSLVNDRGGKEEHTTDRAKVAEFVREWDVPGRGCYYCVSTVKGAKRKKDSVVQTNVLHVDIDLKDVDSTEEHVLGVLEGLEKPPSRVHQSGHGLHALWLLRAPVAADDRVEAILRKLLRALAGDPMVAQTAALMRMPGTHNSKDGGWKEVRVLRRTGDRYSLEEMEEWDAPVVLLKRGAEPPNPFLRVAEEQGFRPPMDVDARLAAMRYRGEGDSAIHLTQLSATASLLSSGLSPDEVVAKVLAATRAAVGSVPWNWAKEEKALYGMCADWEAKGRAGTKPKRVQQSAAGQSNVVSMADHAKEKPVAGGSKGKDAHIVLAKGILQAMRDSGEGMIYTGGQMWQYKQARWRPIALAEEKDWLNRQVERGCQALNLKSKNGLVNETRGWLQRQPELFCEEVRWDDHGKVATRKGLLDLATGRVEAHRADHWTTRWLDCDFDPAARCPRWLRMLGDVLSEEVVRLVQEAAGSFLVENRPRALRRALVFFGASNTGKSNLIAVLAGFFSSVLNTTPLETLENAHGLMPFLQSHPWVLHEAFDQGRWHFSATTKALLSADPVGVNVKNGPLLAHVFKQPILWGTNTPPQFRESTKAMQNRLVTIRCAREFGPEPVGAAKEAHELGYSSPADMVLDLERSGILNWAIEGWQRLQARGHFELPADVAEAMHEMWLQSNFTAAFVEECVELDNTKMIATPDFCGAFRMWWEETRGDQKLPSSQAIGMALQSLGNTGIASSPLLRDKLHRYYAGIKLNEKGLDYWQGFSSSRNAADSGARISGSAAEVAREIPGAWSDKEPIKKMRSANPSEGSPTT